MALEPKKSGTTVLWDTVRYVLIFSCTGVLLYYIGRYSIIFAIVAAVPIFIIMLNLIGFLTLPLYFFTPEGKASRDIFRSLDKGDMASFREQVKTFEKDFSQRTG